MEYGDMFYHTGGNTMVSEINIDDLIFDQIKEIQAIQNTYNPADVKMTIKTLKEELHNLMDLKQRTPGKQIDLFPEMEEA